METSLGPLGSWMFVGPALLTLAFLLARELAAWRRARRDAQAGPRPEALAAGPAVVEGTVRVVDDLRPVAIRLTERGSEFQREGAWSHEWREVEHEVETNPFEIVTAAGVRIEVRPTLDVVLRADLRPLRRSGSTRVREAAVGDGDRVVVTGQLTSAAGEAGVYRGGETRWTLGPPRRGEMIVSTEPLSRTDERLVRFHARGVTGLVVAMLLAAGTFYVDFGRWWLDGEPLAATVSAHHARRSRDHDPELTVDLDVPGHEPIYVHVSRAAYDRSSDGDRVPVLVLPNGAIAMGDQASIGVASVAVSIAILLALVLGNLLRRRSVFAWHEQRPVVTTGGGRL